MKKKINIAELLKDCPKGMRLNCTMYENVYLDKIDEEEDRLYPIICYIVGNGIKNPIHFTKFGEFSSHINAKCVIFPKGKTTWEGFHRPFKDGDVLYTVTGEGEYRICMVDCIIGDMLYTKASCSYNGHFLHICKEQVSIEELVVMRFATKEEKAKLFQAIKDNGYKWNPETKTLDKLPKFKDGDIITDSLGTCIFKGESEFEGCVNYYCGISNGHFRVKDDKCNPSGHYGYIVNYRLSTEEEKEKLFKAIKDNGYKWNDETKTLEELISDKFDISTLKPFDSRVLVRDYDSEPWRVSFWGCLINNLNGYDYYDTTRGYYKQCIPYENNEHLLGKTEDCKDFYKTW